MVYFMSYINKCIAILKKFKRKNLLRQVAILSFNATILNNDGHVINKTRNNFI